MKNLKLAIKLGILSCVLLANAAQAATYYIDYADGSDKDNGTSKTAPWKRHPYMKGWAGSYTHSAGDRFIFKGGVSWPVSCFQMRITVGGSSASNRDYYGVDQTWYSGASWSRPIFDFQQTRIAVGTNGAGVFLNGGSWFHIDNLEMKGLKAGENGYGECSISIYGADHIIISNCYVHDWVMESPTQDNNGAGGIGFFGGTSTGDVEVTHCKLDQAGVVDKNGVSIRNIANLNFTEISHTTQGFLGGGLCHDNHIHDFPSPTNPSAHANAIQTFGPSTIYNNLIHDLSNETAPMLLYPDWSGANDHIDMVYNNVMYRTGWQTPIGFGGGSTNPSRTGIRIFNNTIDAGAGWCVGIDPKFTFAVLDIRNNHFITSHKEAIKPNRKIVAETIDHNLTQTPAQATAAGYTISNKYQPTNGDAPTVDAGTNLALFFAFDRVKATRNVGEKWDLGAYEYAKTSASPTPTPKPVNPPKNLRIP